MRRGLLSQCQLPWSGRLSQQGPKTSLTYAVLANLSASYPPLRGRLPTCYSPVRHFTRGRSPFLVRLACVRPAANVRSEPGSNSPVFRKPEEQVYVPKDVDRNCYLENPSTFCFAIQFSETDL